MILLQKFDRHSKLQLKDIMEFSGKVYTYFDVF